MFRAALTTTMVVYGILLGWLVATPAAAPESVEAVPVIRVQLKTSEPVVRHELSQVDIRNRSGSGRAKGFTEMKLTTTLRLDTSYNKGDAAVGDFWVAAIVVDLKYPAADIYVPREYPERSCQYEAIVAHEQKHVEAQRSLAETYAEKIEAALKAEPFPTSAQPWRLDSITEGKKKAEAQVRKILGQFLDELEREQKRAHQRVDADEGGLALAHCH